jgi:hypothetical protein
LLLRTFGILAFKKPTLQFFEELTLLKVYALRYKMLTVLGFEKLKFVKMLTL